MLCAPSDATDSGELKKEFELDGTHMYDVTHVATEFVTAAVHLAAVVAMTTRYFNVFSRARMLPRLSNALYMHPNYISLVERSLNAC